MFGAPQRVINATLPLKSGYKIPQLGFGTYRMSSAEAEAAVPYAIECGYRHIDCAKVYCNQKAVGGALRKACKDRAIGREHIFVTSKLWPTDQRPDLVERACRETLAELQLDYLDLYLIHWPICWRHTGNFESEEDRYPKDANGLAAVDESVTLLDTWKAMSALVEKGLVRSIGLSNCNIAQVNSVAAADCSSPPVLNQVEVHPGHVNTALYTAHASHDMLTGAYCPLGMPTRHTPSDFVPLTEDQLFLGLSAYTGYSVPRLLLNWNVDMNNVVVVKSSNREHIKANAKAERFALESRVRVVIDGYRSVQRSFRVINPTNFTKSGKPFFDD